MLIVFKPVVLIGWGVRVQVRELYGLRQPMEIRLREN